MKKITFKNRSGFSLIELLFVMGMLGVVMGAVYSLYSVHKKSAYTQAEVVDVQQNLRIAMDSITRDVRMGGFLIPRTFTPVSNTSTDATGTYQTSSLGAIPSDDMTLNTASADETYARISPVESPSAYVVTGTTFTAIVDSPDSVDAFTSSSDIYVRIIRPSDRSQPMISNETGTVRVYKVVATSRTTPAIKLALETGTDPTNINLSDGDMICKTASPYTNTISPNTVRYYLGSGGACPTGQLCLIRAVNGSADVIAQNMANLQFRYLMDDGTEANAPVSDYSKVRAVRATLVGRTVTTANLSTSKERQLDSVIQIKNR